VSEHAGSRLENIQRDTIGRLKTAITGMLVTVGLGGGMRGEEIVRIDIGVIRKHWQEALKHPEEPHIPLAMAGRFKRTVGEIFIFSRWHWNRHQDYSIGYGCTEPCKSMGRQG
jgi:hypothetical protein